MCACDMGACVYACVHACVCVCLGFEAKGHSWVSHPEMPLTFCERESLFGMKHTTQIRLAGQWGTEVCLSLPLQVWFISRHCHALHSDSMYNEKMIGEF